MAKPAARRLKVFQAQFGFYDTVVAARSQAAALRAWGIHQNLFASGEAKVMSAQSSRFRARFRPGLNHAQPISFFLQTTEKSDG